MKVRIIKSKKRRKTVTARLEDGVLCVRVPTALSKDKVKLLVERFKKSIKKKKKTQSLKKQDWLVKRAGKLNNEFFGGKLNFVIKWSKNQKRIYGSCSAGLKTIRISSRLVKLPKWVLDYVLLHELAHLIEANHSKSFWRLVNQYKRAERARGYLMGLGFKEENSDEI
jgi:predicted metal-dependent hydrolase